MDFDEAFGSDVSPEDFFLDHLPELHRERLDQFERFCETTLRMCVAFVDVDERYSVELQPDGARARDGEFIEFPVITIEGTSGPWELVRDYTARAFDRGESALQREAPDNRIDEDFLRDLERFDGVVEISVDFAERDDPVDFRVILNDYSAPPDARKLEVRLDGGVIDAVLEGRTSPTEAVDRVDVSGDMSLAFDLSGMILEHFPELET